MMKSSFRRYCVLSAVAVFLFASASFAQTTTVTLTGTGDNATVYNGSSGVYIDPYTATVGGTTGMSVICDDWANNSYVNEQWTANVTTVSSQPSGAPMFTGIGSSPWGTATQAQLYDALAWLGSQLLANPTNTTNQTVVSFAIWELTSYANRTLPKTDTSDPTAFLAGSSQAGLQGTITALIQQALGIATSSTPFNAQGWQILTPTGASCTSGCPTWPAQEFLVYTPESSTIMMVGADLLGLLALAFFLRRRGLLALN